MAKLKGDRYGFEYLKQCVVDAIELQSLPAERRTIITARMIEVLEAERGRVRRLKQWNDRQKAK